MCLLHTTAYFSNNDDDDDEVYNLCVFVCDCVGAHVIFLRQYSNPDDDSATCGHVNPMHTNTCTDAEQWNMHVV